MRYQNLKSFQKHLSSAAPHHLCRLYLVAISDDFERMKILDLILSYIASSPIRLIGGDCDLRGIFDAMQSMSLLGEPVVILDEVEKISKKDLQTLTERLTIPAGFVLFGARSKLANFAAAIEKAGVVLDLLDEKPWDKEKRISAELLDRAQNAGKKLAPDVTPLLFERLGLDPALLESEIDKLICYVGERAVISCEDVLAITPASKSSTLWQIAEELIWEKGEFPSLDGSLFHGLVLGLRNQLHLGLTLATLIEEKKPADEWGGFLPKLWPKMLEKRSSQAARLGSSYFQKGLEKLFEIELLSRSNSTQYRALLDRFRAQIHAR